MRAGADGMHFDHPALAMIELSSIGRALSVTDAIAKKAPVSILAAEPLSSGKFMLLFGGEVAPTEESLAAGLEIGAELVVNSLLIPNLHAQVLPAFDGPLDVGEVDSLGIVETLSIASTVTAADTAVKAADIQLIQIRLARGIGGKGYFTFTGSLPDVEAAVEAAVGSGEAPWIADTQIVARPHPDAAAQFTRRR